MRRLKQAGIERIVIQRGVDADELECLVASVASGETGKDGVLGKLSHVRVGRIEVEEKIEGVGDMATFRASTPTPPTSPACCWESAAVEGKPTPTRRATSWTRWRRPWRRTAPRFWR
jgi:hypothetical protein